MDVYLRRPSDTFEHECASIMIRSSAFCLGDHFSPYVMRVIKSRGIFGVRHVARREEKRNT